MHPAEGMTGELFSCYDCKKNVSADTEAKFLIQPDGALIVGAGMQKGGFSPVKDPLSKQGNDMAGQVFALVIRMGANSADFGKAGYF